MIKSSSEDSDSDGSYRPKRPTKRYVTTSAKSKSQFGKSSKTDNCKYVECLIFNETT